MWMSKVKTKKEEHRGQLYCPSVRRRFFLSSLLITSVICSVPPQVSMADDSHLADSYVFDDSMLIGTSLGAGGIDRFNKADQIDPGVYRVDVSVNGDYLGRFDISFMLAGQRGVLPCIDRELLIAGGMLPQHISAPMGGNCLILEDAVEAAKTEFDAGSLALRISVPQIFRKDLPRGYVDPALLDSGTIMMFVNYNLNHYHVEHDGFGPNDSSFASFNTGLNIGLWRLRSQSSLSVDNEGVTDWSGTRNYVQRAFSSLQSELTLGDSYTTGRHFSGMAYRGFELASDQRMLPSSQRGYAPVVRGTANTNARVTVRQDGGVIYQTTVPAGAFEIDDLYPTSYDGDLEVEVLEADGSVQRFNVPFSAVPGSLRPGQFRYSVAGGLARNDGDGDDPFGDLVFEYGLNNLFTLNGGVRGAEGYGAAMFGGVFATPVGALGMDITHSVSELPDEEDQSGHMMRLSYSRTFAPVGTSFSLATYRYSTEGYRDLTDVLGVRQAAEEGAEWSSSTLSQRSRFDVSVSQQLGERSSLYVNGITRNYYEAVRERDYEYQLGYNQRLANNINLNLSLNRQENGDFYDAEGETNHSVILTMSAPLGGSRTSPSLSMSLARDRDESSSVHGAIGGAAGEDLSMSYGAYVSRDTDTNSTEVGGNLQKRYSKVSLAGNYSHGSDYWQAGASATGGLVTHQGGITFGPYLTDTFALVEAKGAEGAGVMGAHGVKIDENGYAIVPSLSPYRFNRVALDPTGINGQAELQETRREVAPYAGAAVHLKFQVNHGRGVLITAKRIDGTHLPMGATVLNEERAVVGMVGQASQVYGRLEKDMGTLTVRWGEGGGQVCSFPYELPAGAEKEAPIIKLTATCH